MSRQQRRRLISWCCALLMTALVVLPGQYTSSASEPPLLEQANEPGIPLQEQPFYPQLLTVAESWQGLSLNQVAGETPAATLLNFYAVMAEVGQEVEAITSLAASDPGLGWSPAIQTRIKALNERFKLAVAALDASGFPKSVRADLAQEAALHLKDVLDYVLNSSKHPIYLPASKQEKAVAWRLPQTAIVLSAQPADASSTGDYLFSKATVEQAGRMHRAIAEQGDSHTPFSTPHLHNTVNSQPGRLVAPKWYLNLPPKLRNLAETPALGQTLFQLILMLAALCGAVLIASVLLGKLLHTYRYSTADHSKRLSPWDEDTRAWNRVCLLFPISPLAYFSELFIDAYLSISGNALIAVATFFYTTYYITASLLAYLLMEALGRSSAEKLMQLRGGSSVLMLKRVNNFVMPICRAIGVLLAVALLYRLLILLGLPATTVLAFSAVPGLAIGLGASKLLGNLFAGLSIQTDRPLRVGEFCQVGEHLGFVTKIGLRSIEMETIDSRITIPNAIADDATIVNFSERKRRSDSQPSQGMELRFALEAPLSPDQVSDLLDYMRTEVAERSELQEPVVSVEQQGDGSLSLLCFAVVILHEWEPYLRLREQLLLRIQQIVDVVKKSRVIVGVSYDTTAEQLQQIPELVRSVVNADPDFKLRSCRLMAISEFSYDFVFDFRTTHASYRAFKDGINRMNQQLLSSLESEGIEIPFPTAVEIQKHS